jgi:Sel1 repeat
VAQDYAKAREWSQKAAEKGDATAMLWLGLLYRDGHGVAQDYVKAREWYEKAAEKGDPSAMQSLGLAYHQGQGVAQDYAKAREWYEKAAEKGDAKAMTALGLLYDSGSGVARDTARAREWYEKATDKGDKVALEMLQTLPIRETAEAGHYPEALRLAEARAAEAEVVETKREDRPGKETARVLGELAGYALLAREFNKALTAAERAHALLPADLGIESNRAHALMFMGHNQESDALYLAHKGERMSEDDNRPWESTIAKDFADLRKAGVTHPMMVDIERKLSTTR